MEIIKEDNILYNNNKQPDVAIFLDKLREMDPENYDECSRRTFGRVIQSLEYSIKDIKAFLGDVLSPQNIELCKIERGLEALSRSPWYRVSYRIVDRHRLTSNTDDTSEQELSDKQIDQLYAAIFDKIDNLFERDRKHVVVTREDKDKILRNVVRDWAKECSLKIQRGEKTTT